ncbi:MAG: hypothetical protein AAF830_00275 [Pseudomonadota bacterium]
MARKTQQTVIYHRGIWFIALEFAAIVFGVFLGGYLAERRAGKDLDDLIAQSRAAIQAEMETNFRELNFARDYHLEYYTVIQDYKRGAVGADELYRKMYRGFGLPQVQTGALDAAVAAGLVVYFDTDEFAEISRAYSIAQLNDGAGETFSLALTLDDSNGERIPDIFESAFVRFMVAEDSGLEALAPLVGEEVPAKWPQAFGRIMAERRQSAPSQE